MTLDLNALELKFSQNDKNYGVAFSVERTSYRAGIFCFNAGDAVELLSYYYQVVPAEAPAQLQPNDDAKCNECAELKSTNKFLMRKLREQGREHEAKVASLEHQLTELREQNKVSTQGHEVKVARLEHELNASTLSLAQVQSERDALREELNANNLALAQIQSKNDEMSDELKEAQASLQEMTSKYERLRRNKQIDEKNWREWDTEDAVAWVLSLDDKFEIVGYGDELRRHWQEEDVQGEQLGQIEKGDLHRWGVKNFQHKNKIMTEIKRLTAQQHNPVAAAASPPQAAFDEGAANNATVYL